MERPKLIILILALSIAFLTIAQELYVSMKAFNGIARVKSNFSITMDNRKILVD